MLEKCMFLLNADLIRTCQVQKRRKSKSVVVFFSQHVTSQQPHRYFSPISDISYHINVFNGEDCRLRFFFPDTNCENVRHFCIFFFHFPEFRQLRQTLSCRVLAEVTKVILYSLEKRNRIFYTPSHKKWQD